MVADLLKAYHARYPDITELHTLGNSRQGRPIWALQIPTIPRQMEPTVLMVAAHHGSELLSTEYALDSIDELLRGAEGTQEAWIAELDMWVVPLVNPDGNACLWGIDGNHGRKNCWDMDGNGHIEATEGLTSIETTRLAGAHWERRDLAHGCTPTITAVQRPAQARDSNHYDVGSELSTRCRHVLAHHGQYDFSALHHRWAEPT